MARGDGRGGLEGEVIPIGGIVAAAIAASRAGQGRTAQPTRPRDVILTLRVFAALFVGVPIVIAPTPLGWPLFAVLVACLAPSLVLEGVLLPLGLARTAYYFARATVPLGCAGEAHGGAAFYAARALARRRRIDPRAVAWLDARLARALQIRGASVAAAALIADLRGKKETARVLFHAIEGLATTSPRLPRLVARTWLVADAASRGDWRLVASIGDGPGRMRWPSFMAAVARRLLRDPEAPSDRELWRAWLRAPRRSSLPILRRALAVPVTDPAPVVPLAPTGDALEAALRTHADCLRAPSRVRVAAAGHAWDAVRASASTRALFARRALALEAKATPEALFTRLLDAAESDLAPHAAVLPAADLAQSGTLASASARARRRDVAEIEAIARDMKRRTTRKEALHVSGEWIAWGSLARLCDRTLRGAPRDARRALFATVYDGACNYGVWLFNGRGEKLLANTIFRWLRDESYLVNDAAASALLEKNARAGDGP